MAASPQTPKRARGRPRNEPHLQQAVTVQALDRGLKLLRALSQLSRATLSDLALQVGMPPSTAHRLLTTLQQHGLVDFDETSQEWMIGIETFRIGSSYLVRTNLVELARKTMRRLMEETGETANLAIADKGEVVFVSQIESHNPIRAFFRPGERGHMHSSGIGKALLAAMAPREVENVLQSKGLPEFTEKTLTSAKTLMHDLEITRRRGWSLDDEERYMGMRCVAATIYNAFGEAVAGISVSGPTVRFSDTYVQELGPKVKRAAFELTHLMGGKTPPQDGGSDNSI